MATSRSGTLALVAHGGLALLLAPALAAEPSPTVDSAWPQFAGPTGNFVSATPDLATSWPEGGPPTLWEREVGSGYSAIVGDDTVAILFHREGEEEIVEALAPEGGRTLWTHRYAAPAREGQLVQFGLGPHAAPLLLADRVVTLGYAGSLRALDRGTGELLWSRDLIEEYDAPVLRWGHTASPIAHRGSVIALVGGAKVGAVAFDPATGEERWRSAGTTVSHATPLVADTEAGEQLLYYGDEALYAISPDDGRALWSFPVTNGYKNHSNMPLWLGEERVWLSTQQEGASRVLDLADSRTDGTPGELWFNNKVRIHFWNAVHLDGVVYAAIGDQVANLAAIDTANGEILWRKRGYGQSNLLHTSVGTILLNEEGDLALLSLGRKGVEEISRATVLDSTVWTPPALVGRTLYVRDKETLKALDLASPVRATTPTGGEGAS